MKKKTTSFDFFNTNSNSNSNDIEGTVASTKTVDKEDSEDEEEEIGTKTKKKAVVEDDEESGPHHRSNRSETDKKARTGADRDGAKAKPFDSILAKFERKSSTDNSSTDREITTAAAKATRRTELAAARERRPLGCGYCGYGSRRGRCRDLRPAGPEPGDFSTRR